MKVKITRGTYKSASGLKSRGDITDVSADEARRLVERLGIAQYCGSQAAESSSGAEGEEAPAAATTPAEAETPAKEPDGAEEEDGEGLNEMRFSDLQALAKSMNLSAAGSKKDIIARISAATEPELGVKEAQ